MKFQFFNSIGFALLTVVGDLAHAAPSVTDIQPVAIRPGVNELPGFGPEGETFTIIKAWRGNGNAHGYNMFLVLAPSSEGNPFGVVGIEHNTDGALDDIIRDDPFDGERVLGVIRFAKAKIDGAIHSIVIDAHLDWDTARPLADHDFATIRVYELEKTEGVGGTPELFTLISTTKTKKRFCNAELALHETLGIPLSPDYAGPNQSDGCF